MRNKLKYMLEVWGEAGFVVQLTLSNGLIVTGRLKEIEADDVIMEPEIDGRVGPLTVVQLAHVAMATYVDPETDSAES